MRLIWHTLPHTTFRVRAAMNFQGAGGVIKPGDTLLFDVELLGFHEKAKERWEMSAAELMEEATKIKVKKAVGSSQVKVIHVLVF